MMKDGRKAMTYEEGKKEFEKWLIQKYPDSKNNHSLYWHGQPTPKLMAMEEAYLAAYQRRGK